MPKLKPLEQFVCDTCGEVIADPEKGYVVWKSDDKLRAYGWKIIHQAAHSPGYPKRSCDNDKSFFSSSALPDFLGPLGLVRCLAKIDVGPYHDREYDGHMVRDLREWTEFMRRLHLPFYEEARGYWSRASGDYFQDVNEVRIYMPDYLKAMIEHFENG